MLIALWAFMQFTPYGRILRAGSRDPEMVGLLGIRLPVMLNAVFGLGCCIAGIAGVLAAPLWTVYPAMQEGAIMPAFVVVTIGGVGFIRRRGDRRAAGGGGHHHDHPVRAGRRQRSDVRIHGRRPADPTARTARGTVGAVRMITPIVEYRPGPRGILRHPIVWVCAVLIALTALWAALGAPTSLITEIAIYTLYGAGVNLLVGYTGLVPFGASVFFGCATYAAAISMKRLFSNEFEAIVSDHRLFHHAGRHHRLHHFAPPRTVLLPADPGLLPDCIRNRLQMDGSDRWRERAAGRAAAHAAATPPFSTASSSPASCWGCGSYGASHMLRSAARFRHCATTNSAF